jgi:hypothetical protein
MSNFEINPVILRSNIATFKSDYPTTDRRLEVAQRLADPDETVEIPMPKYGYPSYLTFAGHWGHNDDQLSDLIRHVYGTTKSANQFVGQSMIVFETGSEQDALEEKDLFSADVDLICAKIMPEPVLNHRFKGKMNQQAKQTADAQPSQLDMAVSMPLKDPWHIRAGFRIHCHTQLTT